MLLAFLTVVAQTTTSPTSAFPWSDAVRYGLTPVVVLALIVTGLLRVGVLADRQQTREDAAWQQRLADATGRAERAETSLAAAEDRERRLRDANEEKVLPALISATQAQRSMLETLTRRAGDDR